MDFITKFFCIYFFQSATKQEITTLPTRPTTSQIRLMSARSASLHFVTRALIAEAEAGFPLRHYLKRCASR